MPLSVVAFFRLRLLRRFEGPVLALRAAALEVASGVCRPGGFGC